MNSKVALVALFALLAVNQSAGQRDLQCTIIDTIEPIFESLVSDFDKVIIDTGNKVEKFFGDILNGYLNQLNRLVDGSQKSINGLCDAAENSGFNVAECRTNGLKELEDIVKETDVDAQKCVHPLKEDFEDAVLHSKSQVDRVGMEINTLDKRCLTCEAPECFEGVHVDAKELLLSLPKRIKLIGSELKSVAYEVVADADTCITKLDTKEKEVTEVHDKVVNCVKAILDQ